MQTEKFEQISRIKHLSSVLKKAAKAYYNDNIEIISNLEYDTLYQELEELERATGLQLSDSPTVSVGYSPATNLAKITHETPLLSLDKTKEVDKIADFLAEHTGLISWKLDGLTIALIYENGELIRGITRGNGILGEDVTHNVRIFKNIPLRIAYKNRLLIRGEAVITYEDFDEINANIANPADKYKNPRNLCSGTVRQLDSTGENRAVHFYAFSMLTLENQQTKLQQLQFLEQLGFDTAEYQTTTAATIKQDISHLREKLPQMGVPSDGLVITYNDIAYSNSLGTTSKFPKDSLAFKWQDEQMSTKLLNIDWNTSRTGLINPVAIFEPVELEGTTVNKASLHNISIIKKLKLGIGDTITVYKANMIIPQVAENLTQSDTVQIPQNCPVCNSPTEIFKQKEGEFLLCLNPNCSAQLVGSLVHFCSRDAMNIEGLSEQTIEKWVNNGFIQNYVDIFDLSRHKNAIIQMDGFGEKSYENLANSINNAKNVNLANFIFALGIKHVGLSNAKLLCNHFGDLSTIIQKTTDKETNKEELLKIKGFGEAISNSICIYFDNPNNIATLEKFSQILEISVDKKNKSGNNNLSELTFVITGKTEIFDNRKQLQAKIEEHGGKCSGSVSAKTSYLINNDATSTSGKNKKAHDLGVKIITEKDFVEMFINVI
ncbi:MAG: NAD-dependent DNA ligase LigA [Firmicutes bacterium]|nr:NAD-dependent DNA ligase LigA [Bacillota bacterium]